MMNIAKVPALPLVLCVAAGLLLAFGIWVTGIVTLLLALGSLSLSPRWITILSLILGAICFLNHHQEVKQTREAREFLASFKYNSFEIAVPKAKVLAVKKTSKGYIAEVRVLSEDAILLGASPSVLKKGILLSIDWPESLMPSEVISFTGHMRRTRSYGNFGKLDWSGVSERRGIAGAVKVERLERISYHPLRKMEQRGRKSIKGWILKRIRYGLNENSTAYRLLPALLFGDKSTEAGWIEEFRRAGVMHIFVVSGLHIGMLVLAVWLFLYVFPISSPRVLVLSLLIVWAYAWLTGLNPPVVRSAFTLSLFALGLLFRLRITPLNTLLVAFLIIIMTDHYALYEVGVWLSFGVVLGLISFANLIARKIPNYFSPDPYLPKILWSPAQRIKISALKGVSALLATGTIAWITSSLITAISFGKVYVLGAIASWVVLPSAFLMMINSGIALLLSCIAMPLAKPFNGLNDILGARVLDVVKVIDDVPWAVWHVRDHEYDDALTVFNLPKGRACLYLAAEGGLLIDTGNENSARSEIKPILERAGLPYQRAIISHQDSGHDGGLGILRPPNVALAYDEPTSSYNLDTWQTETFPIQVPDSRRSDDNLALIKISKEQYSIGYISDAGLEVFQEVTRRKIPFQCDVLIIGENANDQNVVEDFASYTGAESIILGRTTSFSAPRSLTGISCYDQRYCGAVRIRITDRKIDIQSAFTN